jgi:Protein of unknown function (DUF2505)
MATRRIEQFFECSVGTFWKSFFDLEYNRKLFIERLRFETWQQLSHTPTADGFRRVVQVVPRVGDVPAAIKGLMKNGAGYREEGEFIESQSLYRLRAVPNSLPDRVHITGEMRVEPAGENRCKRSYLAVVEAKVMLVGGLLENRILDDTEKGYQRAEEVTARWLEETGTRGT